MNPSELRSPLSDFLRMRTLTARLALFFLAALAATAVLFTAVERSNIRIRSGDGEGTRVEIKLPVRPIHRETKLPY